MCVETGTGGETVISYKYCENVVVEQDAIILKESKSVALKEVGNLRIKDEPVIKLKIEKVGINVIR